MNDNRILSMTAENFKGLKERTFKFGDGVNSFYGTNGSFKTTLIDLFFWTMTSNDSHGRNNFEIKTRDGDKVESRLNHSGEIHFKDFKIKRIFHEVWKTKRGTTEQVMNGHTTDYLIDYNDGIGFVVIEKEKDFVEFMEEKFGGKDFARIIQLCSNPKYFVQMLDWKERRKLIFDIVGETSDAEIIEKLPELPVLQEMIKVDKPENLIPKFRAKLNSINKELQELSVRIDESEKKKPEIVETKEAIETRISSYKKQIEEAEEAMKEVEIDSDLKKQLQDARDALSNAKRAFVDKNTEDKKNFEQTKNKAFNEYSEKKKKLEEELDFINRANEKGNLKLKDLRERQSELEEKFKKKKAEKWEGSDTCPTCKQLLPDSQIDKLRSEFNDKRAEKLKSIIAEASEVKAEIEDIEEKMKAIGNADDVKKKISELEVPEKAEFKEPVEDYSELKKKISDLEEEMTKSKATVEERRKPLKDKKKLLEDSVEDLVKELAKFDEIKRADKRIQEHRDRQEELSIQFAEFSEKIDALNAFIVKKVETMEQGIFDVFGIKFSMFEIQINGGVKEECRTLVDCDGNEIPFETANNASQNNIGVKACSVLQKYYGMKLPIFVDNAESIVKLVDIPDCQIVRLVVSEEHKTLTKK